MKRAVFMGSDTFSVSILDALTRQGPKADIPLCIVSVVTQPDRRAGRGKKLTANPVADYARRAGLPLQQPASFRSADSVCALADSAPDVIVVASYGQILPAAALAIPTRGALNLHPSLLPRFRGPSPIAGAILDGESVTGTSLMVMTAKMDAGPVIRQRVTNIGNQETTGELTARLATMSASLLMQELGPWLRGRTVPVEQDERLATYTKLVHKGDANIDWNLPAEIIARRIRAYNPWPIAFSYWGDRQVRILRGFAAPGMSDPGRVIRTSEGNFAIGTGSDLVIVQEMQLAGSRPHPSAVVLHGHPGLLGAQLSREG